MTSCRVGIFAIRLSSGQRLSYNIVDWFCIDKEMTTALLVHINYHPDTAALELMTVRQYNRFCIFCNA